MLPATITNTCGELPEEERIKMNKLAAFLILTSQGIAFITAGEELLKTKGGIKDSFKSPDSVNKMDWNRKRQYKDVFEYYKGLIKLRKSHPAFRMTKTVDIQKNLSFLDSDVQTVAYIITNNANGDAWSNIAVIANAGAKETQVVLPKTGWTVAVNGEKAGVEEISIVDGNTVTIPGRSGMVLFS